MTHSLLHQKMTNPPSSLSGSNTSVNRFRIFYIILMPSTSNSMIKIRCHIGFRWETKFGFTCRNNALQGPIRSFTHSVMLVVELDYLPDSDFFCFHPCLYPMKYLHPISMYTLPHGGVLRRVTPLWGSRGLFPWLGGLGESGGLGAKPPKGKFPCKCILQFHCKSGPFIIRSQI
jgi:hypothetical protein